MKLEHLQGESELAVLHELYDLHADSWLAWVCARICVGDHVPAVDFCHSSDVKLSASDVEDLE